MADSPDFPRISRHRPAEHARRSHRPAPDGRTRRTSASVQRPASAEGTIADHLFFIAGGFLSVWLGIVLLVQGSRFGWGWYAVVLLASWVVLAYVTLPRLHRILSSVYVPNYFIGRARTSDGLLGDPVNVAVVGEASQLHRAMLDAGWTRADDITAQSTWRIVISTITRRSYDEAPVSPLFLFGRRQDFAYQQEVDGNPGKRHHVRFWRCPDGWLLPGGRRVDWLAAGTYDRAVGFSVFTLQVTHKIDENTDIERDHIVDTLSKARRDVRVTLIEDFSTGYHSRNGGGDSIVTDGDLPIIDVRSLPIDTALESDDDAALILDATGHDQPPSQTARDLWQRRPLALIVGCALAVLSSLIGVGRFLWQLRNFDAITELQLDRLTAVDLDGLTTEQLVDIFWGTVIGVSVLIVLVQLVLALLAARGIAGARLLLMTVLCVSATGTLLLAGAEAAGRIGLLIDLTTMLLLVSSLMALSSTASRTFVAARRRAKHHRKRERRQGSRRAVARAAEPAHPPVLEASGRVEEDAQPVAVVRVNDREKHDQVEQQVHRDDVPE